MYITIIYRNRQKGDQYEPGFIITEHTENGNVVANLPYWYTDVRCDTLEESRHVAHFLARTEITRRYPAGIVVREQNAEAATIAQSYGDTNYSPDLTLTKSDLFMIFGPTFLCNMGRVRMMPGDKLFNRTVKRILKHEMRHAEQVRKSEISAQKQKMKERESYYPSTY